MFCSQCGKQLENNALFCTFCGKRTNNPNVAPAAVSQPVGTATAAVQAPIQPTTEPDSAENNTTVSENSAPIPALRTRNGTPACTHSGILRKQRGSRACPAADRILK